MKWLALLLFPLIGFCGLTQDEENAKNYPPPGEPGPDRVYLRIAVYAFQALDHASKHSEPYPEPILKEALAQAGSLLGIPGFSFQTGTQWQVISEGDMYRPLDYRENFHIFSEYRRVRFTIIYDHDQRYLTLKDFIINNEQNQQVLRASIGIADGGASVLGSMKKQEHGSTLMVVAFETSPKPFPDQATHATFTVKSLRP